LKQSIVVVATDVHHVMKVAENPEMKLIESNCMALCHECHSARTGMGE
jgi:5-methylcytosine-specific restriction endonuclease McrA